MKGNAETIAVYSRKSKFTGKGESIENQIELCRQYIFAHFPGVEEENILVFEDEGFSGGTTERPQFKVMMKQAKEHRFKAVVCYRLDRISRNIGDFAKLIEDLNALSISFVSIKEQFDTQSPMGRAMMYIASVFSQLERETIAERIRDNMQELAKTGRWLGGVTPTGYVSEPVDRVTVDGKTRRMYQLTQIPEESELVRVIFAKFLETGSLTKTETYLLQNGIQTKNGKAFTRFSIKNILSNPVYLTADEAAYQYFEQNEGELFSPKSAFDGAHGVMAYNKTIQKPGKANELRNLTDWIIAVGKHEGIISSGDWIRVQTLLNHNKSKSYRKPKSNTALLSGLLFCANCGGYLRPKLSKRKNAKGELIYSYLCETKEKSRCQLCNMKNPNGNALDELVAGEIKKLSADPDAFLSELADAERVLLRSRTEYEGELARLRKLIDENEKEITGLLSSLSKAAGTPAEDYILRQIGELHEKEEGFRRQMEALQSVSMEHALSGQEFDLLKDLLSSFAGTFDNMSVEQKRAALRAFVKRVVWDGETVHVYLFGSKEEVELPPVSGVQDDEPQGANSK